MGAGWAAFSAPGGLDAALLQQARPPQGGRNKAAMSGIPRNKHHKPITGKAHGDRHRELVLAHIDRNHDRRGRHLGSMNNHETHLRRVRRKTNGATTPDLRSEPERSLPRTSGGVREGLPRIYISNSLSRPVVILHVTAATMLLAE